MCPVPGSTASKAASSAPDEGQKTCFTCRRLNASTFLIVEDDKYREYPFIYAKVYPSVIVLIDTGCGGAVADPASVELTSLREYIETEPVVDNGGEPLNAGSRRGYVVICTHCHFDHIGGIAQFSDADNSAIWASSHDKDFLSKARLPSTSLCDLLEMETPSYAITNWADDGQAVTHGGSDLGLVVYHTPGHTPDEIAIWDAAEGVRFVGDTLYEWVPIVFPLEGDVVAYGWTLERLRGLVAGWNALMLGGDGGDAALARRVKIAAGHVTSDNDAAELLEEAESFLRRVLEGGVVGKDGEDTIRGEQYVSYQREDGRVSFWGPNALFERARAARGAVM